MNIFHLLIVYLLFFLSGAAALIYQVYWVRSLGLVFGGSHLAITTVLAVFMAGLALGGYFIGKIVDNIKRPLRLYGLLEIGIALFALAFVGLMRLYPIVYVSLAQGHEQDVFYLSVIRVLFAIVALLVPTTLMGGTLPVLTLFMSRRHQEMGSHLSFLYGFNTLGALVGTVTAGFFLLRFLAMSGTLATAILINVLVGLAAIYLQGLTGKSPSASEEHPEPRESLNPAEATAALPQDFGGKVFQQRLVLWGIGISGFCALGYEVLWTRILTLVVGASVYGFTTMLAAFLAGIALGSKAYGLLIKMLRGRGDNVERSILWFGAVQIIIGLTAALVTFKLRNLPVHSIRLLDFFQKEGVPHFHLKMAINFLLAFLYMVIPAFFMGLAFPLAGSVHARYKARIGKAVGEILAFNTIGAILGAAASGFALIYLFGIERSLQLLIVINLGFGLLVIVSTLGSRMINWSAGAVAAAIFVLLAANPSILRFWDTKYFAVFQNNNIDAFRTPEKIREVTENTDVLYYGEGVEAIISSIKVKGGDQGVLVNGKVVASTELKDHQCQYTLGHLPMLLHPEPRKVLVVGLGTGMTLGAVSIHPTVEELTAVEIEPKVVPAARTFAEYNHRVIDNPKLRLIFNDGRNFLLTTSGKFDVITADPIHPWAQGASYLYTDEYFRLASRRLNPGGIMCQWLPIYELSPADLKSVVKTFQNNFKHTLLWFTYYDAELIGSNSPLLIDEAELERRILDRGARNDLNQVMMGNAADFLSYFTMGTSGLEAFSREGTINTDDNLFLEFSSPLSHNRRGATGENVEVLNRYRESILPYLQPAATEPERILQREKWQAHAAAADLYGAAHALFISGEEQSPQFQRINGTLAERYPWYAPGKVLRMHLVEGLAREPKLLDALTLAFVDHAGVRKEVEIAAVLTPITRERAAIIFVDSQARRIISQLEISAARQRQTFDRMLPEVFSGIREIYRREVESARARGETLPSEGILPEIEIFIEAKVREYSPVAADAGDQG